METLLNIRVSVVWLLCIENSPDFLQVPSLSLVVLHTWQSSQRARDWRVIGFLTVPVAVNVAMDILPLENFLGVSTQYMSHKHHVSTTYQLAS